MSERVRVRRTERWDKMVQDLEDGLPGDFSSPRGLQAIRDGVIEASINHEKGYVQSKEMIDIYSTREPQLAFHQRISFCLDIHNMSVKVRSGWPRAPAGSHVRILPARGFRREGWCGWGPSSWPICRIAARAEATRGQRTLFVGLWHLLLFLRRTEFRV